MSLGLNSTVLLVQTRTAGRLPAPVANTTQHCTILLGVVVSSSMLVLTTDSVAGAGQFMQSVVRPCSCTSLTMLPLGSLEEGFKCHSFRLLLGVPASLAVNSYGLQSTITGPGVSPHSHIRAACGVVGSTPRMDMACQLKRSWRLSRIPTLL
jgi:hypothetical protein